MRSAVTLENKKIGVQRSARMYNYSDCGLYIEADHRLEPQTEIRIGIANSPFAAEPDEYESHSRRYQVAQKLKAVLSIIMVMGLK